MSPHPEESTTNNDSPAPESTFNISNEETVRRLRAKGQPIRLFGESDKDRRLRLRALELIEEKDHERHGGQNDFKKALEDVENVERLMKDKQQQEAGRDKGKKKEGESMGSEILDLGLVKTDPDKLYPIIYYALKRALKEWEQWMDERPGELVAILPLCTCALCMHKCRTCEAYAPGQARRSYTEAVRRVPETTLQTRTCTSTFSTLLRQCWVSSYISLHRTCFRTCSLVSRKLSTTCRSDSTRERTTPTCGYLSVMPHGLLELRWLGM